MTTFYKNYLRLCAQHKMSLSAVAEAVGLSRTSPNGWKKGKNPSAVTLEKLSQYFGVSVEDLTTEQTNEKPAIVSDDGPSDSDIRLSDWFHSLPPERQLALLNLGGAPKELLDALGF